VGYPLTGSADRPQGMYVVQTLHLLYPHEATCILDVGGATDFGKTTITRRILDSVLYDLGKLAVQKFPMLGHANSDRYFKTYLGAVFSEWCMQFRHMSELENVKVDYSGERQFPFKVYLRAKISMGFSHAMKKYRKS
jgi:ABC-type polar amino acid transport system ATPase subunit